MKTTPSDAVENLQVSEDHPLTQERQVIFAPNPTPRAQPKKPALGSKRAAVLRELLTRGQRGLNRFEAERLAFDHVLPSTISELCKDFGLEIPRYLETVTGHFNRPTDCCRYWLSRADRVKVRALLDAEPEAAA